MCTWLHFKVELCGVGKVCNGRMAGEAERGGKVGNGRGWTGLRQLEAGEDGLWRTRRRAIPTKLRKKKKKN